MKFFSHIPFLTFIYEYISGSVLNSKFILKNTANNISQLISTPLHAELINNAKCKYGVLVTTFFVT